MGIQENKNGWLKRQTTKDQGSVNIATPPFQEISFIYSFFLIYTPSSPPHPAHRGMEGGRASYYNTPPIPKTLSHSRHRNELPNPGGPISRDINHIRPRRHHITIRRHRHRNCLRSNPYLKPGIIQENQPVIHM